MKTTRNLLKIGGMLTLVESTPPTVVERTKYVTVIKH